MGQNINGAKYRNAPPRVIKRVLAAERKVTPDGCWLWQGEISRDGYGVARYKDQASRPGKRLVVYVHRFVYIWCVRDLDDSLELDHTCHDPAICTVPADECPHRRCFNPDHLEPVTTAVNLSRSGSVSAVSSQRDRCSKGHLYTKANTRWYKGTRQCRVCHRGWRAESYKRTGYGNRNERARALRAAKLQERSCIRCGVNIAHRGPRSKYCEECAVDAERERQRKRQLSMATHEDRGKKAA